ncbi:hypothetical protein VAEKB19_7230001 [Vibrio aestuarianus]|nr:hypothetical protein VAEKB19_7230001 [Vibrio aestuarianus]
MIVVASVTNTLLAKRHSKAKVQQKSLTTASVAGTAVKS